MKRCPYCKKMCLDYNLRRHMDECQKNPKKNEDVRHQDDEDECDTSGVFNSGISDDSEDDEFTGGGGDFGGGGASDDY